jgi:pSer/pThr/pTyr-binding forkhead associated (FHA) protein
MARIRITVKGAVQSEVDVDHEITIGRKPPADVVVADGEVSSRHARLRLAGDRLMVADLGSTNGSRIGDGPKLTPNVEVALERGAKLLVGPAVIERIDVAAPAPAAETPPPSENFSTNEKTMAIGAINAGGLRSAIVDQARFEASQPRLVIAAEHEKRVAAIEDMEVVVGRDAKQAKIVVQHPSVSSRHAKIRFDKGKFFVEDLKSVNGTFVDGAPVVAPTPVASEQALTFGTVDCLFVHRPAETGGGGVTQDEHADALCDHAVRLRKATQQQAKEVLAEHRRSGASLGQLFVERGIIAPKEWSEIYRQRQMLVLLSAKKGPNMSKVVGVVVAIVGAIAVAVFFLMKSQK